MNPVHYKGYEIIPAPYQLQKSREWTIDLYIAIEKDGERNEKKFNADNSYESKDEAISHCVKFGKRIIDGEVENCTVAGL